MTLAKADTGLRAEAGAALHPFRRGRHIARLAGGAADLARVLDLRARAFGRPTGVSDRDALDDRCLHVMVEGPQGEMAAAFRVLVCARGADLHHSYAARFYDLSRLAALDLPMAEMGRFCLSPAHGHPDALRLAWAAMTRIVAATGARFMTGCSSFAGAGGDRHRPALALLAQDHIGPAALLPGRRAADVVDYPPAGTAGFDRRSALAAMPPLLRSYLGMGGWVGDHAVADHDLDTLHVFTCVEVARMPQARVASLRAIAG